MDLDLNFLGRVDLDLKLPGFARLCARLKIGLAEKYDLRSSPPDTFEEALQPT